MQVLIPTTPEQWRMLLEQGVEIPQALREAVQKLSSNEAEVRAKPKPTTQVLGVAGLDAGGVGARYGSPPRWSKLAGLPPFQMFMRERAENDPSMQSDQWAMQEAAKLARTIGDDKLIDEYCTWHERKGLWPRETPYGQIKE